MMEPLERLFDQRRVRPLELRRSCHEANRRSGQPFGSLGADIGSMRAARFAILAAALGATVSCNSAGGSAVPSAILLSPNGTASQPVDESINESFTLMATEAGYSGSFTATKISGQCFKVQPPLTSSGSWVVAPQGLYCIGGSKGDTEEFEVTDMNGHSAVTYIHTI